MPVSKRSSVDERQADAIEAIRLAIWHATDRPPDMVEVARFRAKLRALGWKVAPRNAS